jgi:hypothetical protein
MLDMIEAELSALNCIECGPYEQEISRAGAKKIVFEVGQDLVISLRLIAEDGLAKAASDEATNVILVSRILRVDYTGAKAAQLPSARLDRFGW